jgi:predicted Fe-S protein YdhL (DUF1289 family)
MTKAQIERQLKKVQEKVQENQKVLVVGRIWSVSEMLAWLKLKDEQKQMVWFGLGEEQEGQKVELEFKGEKVELEVVRVK